MLEFIQEALDEYTEVHESRIQSGGGGNRFLIVKVDLADGEGLKEFSITASELPRD